jgi:hypothetical protein
MDEKKPARLSARQQDETKIYSFEAALKMSSGMDAAYIEFPYDVQEKFGTRGQVKVKALFDGAEYRGSLVPMGQGAHCLGVTKAIRSAIGKNPGDRVAVRLWKDTAPRTVEVPEDVRHLLEKHGLAEAFSRLSITRRKTAIDGINGSNRPETRKKRVQGLLEALGGEATGGGGTLP